MFKTVDEIFEYYKSHEELLPYIPNLSNLELKLKAEDCPEELLLQKLLTQGDQDLVNALYLDIGVGD